MMRARRVVRCVVVASTLCGAGHPAFADGSLPSEEAIRAALIKLGILAAGAILVLVLLIKGLYRLRNAAERRRLARAAAPQIPTARVVESTDAERRQG